MFHLYRYRLDIFSNDMSWTCLIETQQSNCDAAHQFGSKLYHLREGRCHLGGTALFTLH